MGRQRPSLLHEEISLGQQGRFHLEKVGSGICQLLSSVSSRPCVQIPSGTTAGHSPGQVHFPSLLRMTMTKGCPQPPALGSVTSALLLEGHYCLSADFTTLLPHPSAFCLLHPRSVLSRYAIALRRDSLSSSGIRPTEREHPLPHPRSS